MEFKDYYKILGVERSASADDIKKAFRKLARKYHPDVSKEKDAEARMKEVNEAYAVLSDPEKKAAYDDVGHRFKAGQDFRPPPDWDAGYEFSGAGPEAADFSDFFSELFGSRMGGMGGAGGMGGGRRAGGGGGGRGRRFDMRGEDHHAKILLDIEDAYRGGSRQITLRTPQQSGHRVSMAERTLDVNIPKGVHEGQMIRLSGQGSPGMNGGAPGDLYLEVEFKPHPRYRAEGRDVYATLPVAPWEAALGDTVKAQVPDSTLEIRIPEGSQSGRKLRLKGRGIPGATPGDLYLVVEVVLPPADTEKAREFYRRMATELAFNPRKS